jgi:hypothetical protein
MVTIRTSLPVALLILLLILAAKTGYDYYRVFAWRQTSATIISARQTCEYAKRSSSRSYYREYPLCDDDVELARLTGEGYKLRNRRRLRIEAIYEVEPGKSATVTLEPWLEDAGLAKPGSIIKICVSSGSAELAIPPDPLWGLLLIGVALLLGGHAYVKRAKANAGQASSIS